VEKGYRAWGHDLTPDDTPQEAGLAFAVRPGKDAAFIGREAFLRQRDAGAGRRMVSLVMDDTAAFPIGGEPILHEGAIVGQVTSAAFGHTVGRAVALGYVERDPDAVAEMIAAGGFALDIACETFPAQASLKAPYDPEGARLRP
jgi:4-methylaminobutanoate oxidase (formaldehyde-forming)